MASTPVFGPASGPGGRAATLSRMSLPLVLPEFICCPGCQGSLEAVGLERLDCAECASVYPVFDGTPWLYRDVSGSRAQWAGKLQQFRMELLAEHGQLEMSAKEKDLLASTRERLSRQKAGLERLGQQIFGLLECFGFSHSEAGGVIPADRIPSQQHVSSYLETVFRDWCWGNDEVRETLAQIVPHLGAPKAAANALVLGGGGGRLSLELARLGRWESVVQLDLNPLLTRIGQKVANGETLNLTELPRFPLGLDHVAVDQQLIAPQQSGAESAALYFLLGDVFAPPFARECFDLLVTPWFVDILPASFRRIAVRLGSLLNEGGRWTSFGPLSFESVEAQDRLTAEEMTEALEEAGFEVLHAGFERVSYLHSPHGMTRRGEEIFVFSAVRREARSVDEEQGFYPSWMTDGALAIPAAPEFEQLRAERTFDLEILKCVDGRASIDDIVSLLSNRFGLEPDRCRNTVNRFFIGRFEGGS
jgi:uncharacterized protein YbaR (Trm112 family)